VDELITPHSTLLRAGGKALVHFSAVLHPVRRRKVFLTFAGKML